MKIPDHGASRGELFTTLEEYRAHDMPWRDGRTWAYIYDPGEEAERVIKDAFTMYLTENALDPTVFPSTLRLENEVVSMAISHLHGDDKVVGNFTSGGTESIICAVKAARDYARAKRPDITEPEIVLPTTGHAAFHKAAHYLCLKPVLVPVDNDTFKPSIEDLRDAITPNTIMMVGSAISYAHGVVDPIEEMGALAQERDVWLHVDGCMGGFLLQYFRRLGRAVPLFDFRVPGVLSISMDLHKYAFAAKGASVIMYRSKEFRRHQMYACSNWTGYTIINPTVQSTKSGGPVAAAWAVLNYFGDEGYMKIAESVLEATDRVAHGVESIPELRLLGKPEMNLVAFTSDTVNIFHIIDEMKERGWYVQPQLAYENSRENIHLSINPASVRWVDDMLADLRECVEVAKTLPGGKLAEQVNTMFASMEDVKVTPAVMQGLLNMASVKGSELPGRMAEINEVLNTLPVALREALLIEYFNDLVQQV